MENPFISQKVSLKIQPNSRQELDLKTSRVPNLLTQQSPDGMVGKHRGHRAGSCQRNPGHGFLFGLPKKTTTMRRQIGALDKHILNRWFHDVSCWLSSALPTFGMLRGSEVPAKTPSVGQAWRFHGSLTTNHPRHRKQTTVPMTIPTNPASQIPDF